MINSCNILERVKEYFGVQSDSQLATLLGVKKSTLSNWKARNSIDYELLFTKCDRADIGWLIMGENDNLTKLANRLSDIISLLYDHTRDNDTERLAHIMGLSQLELINFTNNLIFPKQPIDFAALVKEYPGISYEWLLTGRGKPLNVDESDFDRELKERYHSAYIDRISKELNSPKNQIVDFSLSTDRKIAVQQIPLYELNASAGIMAIFNDVSINPTDYLRIPNLPSVDGAIYVCGESMMPLLKSGDIVIFKKLSLSMDSILWGQIYLLSFEVCGDYFTVVKYIQKSDRPDSIRLVSENSRYEPKDIPLSSIRALAIVKASITFHTIE